jgi:membrane protease YdiL (CAAX protease family)
MNKIQEARWRLACSVLLALGSISAVWYGLFPLAGYSRGTLMLAQLATPAIGLSGIALWRLGWREVGLSIGDLGRAAASSSVVTALFLLLAWPLRSVLASGVPLLRPEFSLRHLLDNWILTGLGEEILFCGLLFNLTLRALPARRRSVAVLPVALAFAAWHLPGYLARGLPLAGVGGRLALNIASWLFFGVAYALSGNLWLAAFMHANTNYAISPLMVGSPPLGLLFMGMMVAAAWLLGRRMDRAPEPTPLSEPG